VQAQLQAQGDESEEANKTYIYYAYLSKRMQHTSSDSGFELESRRERRKKEGKSPTARRSTLSEEEARSVCSTAAINFIAACRGEVQHVTRSRPPVIEKYNLQVPICRRDHRLVWVIAELSFLIRLKALEYCFQFARRLLFAG
jgi:hypothetical protein